MIGENREPSERTVEPSLKMQVHDVSFWYGEKQALKNVNLVIPDRSATAFIGPSGCGKSTMLKCLNRMHDDGEGVTHNTRMTGQILLDGADIYSEDVDPPMVRRRFGWVAQKPNPFPWTVYENVAYGPGLHGLVAEGEAMEAHVEQCLRRTGLWDEVKDRLEEAGTDLSGGQQQRLCVARALAVEPDVLLMDEPAGSLDPISTELLEELVLQLKRDVAIVIITHNMEQAARVADQTAFFQLGEVLETGPTAELFTAPKTQACRDYLAGRFG